MDFVTDQFLNSALNEQNKTNKQAGKQANKQTKQKQEAAIVCNSHYFLISSHPNSA